MTQPSPRVTPKTSVVGSMRRPDHGTQLSAPEPAGAAASAGSIEGVPAELGTYTMAALAVLMGGAILVLRSRPISPQQV